jgi:hypothetical protein
MTVRNIDENKVPFLQLETLSYSLHTWDFVGTSAFSTRTTSTDFNVNEYIESIAAFFETTVDQVELKILKRE